MIFNKIKIFAQIIGFAVIGLLTVYGSLAIINDGHLAQAAGRSPTVAPVQVPQLAPQGAPLLDWGNATVPLVVNYQGNLKDAEGNPLSGSYTMTFRIYAGVTTTTAL
ncbi:MAG: hypothetical protein GY869_26985, partial [Planctomycetes bacterium]|nr:hypothetical protein [Planctomycetota bacterium]